jgi:glycosyltransferase involved in cell wall biosynthesis
VCIATGDIIGPIRNGGIGTAYFSLASALAEAGHDVTVLYLLGDYCEQGSLGEWRAYYRERGMKFVPLPPSPIKVDGPHNAVRSHDAYRWLRAREFDVIHFPEWQGYGYFTGLAKHQGLDFPNTTICIGVHSPSLWHKALNREFLKGPDDLEIDFMERQSVALADAVVSPSRYMLRWMENNGWQLPEKRYVQPYILAPSLWARWEEEAPAGWAGSINELVFFGRLEERKGLRLFCDAIDSLSKAACPPFKLTFLGKNGKIAEQDAVEYIDKRASKWICDWQILTNQDSSGALDYLREGNRIAVIASLIDNSPNTVTECLHLRIPFIASRTGGIPELIATDGIDKVTFPLDSQVLADRLCDALRDGIPLVRPAADPEINRQRWIAWHDALPSMPASAATVRGDMRNGSKPLVSVCLVHHDRPRLLRQAIASLEAQDYPNFEIILVDDGSTTAESIATLDHLQESFRRKEWQLIRQSNQYPGAARNAAAAHANGDYLLFMDDDNWAKPDEISTFVRVAEHSKADILTCFLDCFTGAGEPANSANQAGRWLFLGAALAPSMFTNRLGDTNFFIRKSVFHLVGGFTEDRGISNEDWEFLARAVLNGFHLEVVPKALVWYRLQESSFLRTTSEYDNMMRSLRPYLEAVPASLRDLLRMALGAQMQSEREQVRAASNDNSNAYLGDEELLKLARDRLIETGHGRLATYLENWMDYVVVRKSLPARRLERLPHVARQLVRGRYHRFAHGIGSALRDLYKASKPRPKSPLIIDLEAQDALDTQDAFAHAIGLRTNGKAPKSPGASHERKHDHAAAWPSSGHNGHSPGTDSIRE